MPAGSWRSIPSIFPGGVARDAFFRSSTGANNHFDYAESGAWDSVSRCLFYYGGGHNSQPVFLRWCEQTGAWTVMPRPGWINYASTNIYTWFVHAYDRNTIDPATRTAYFVGSDVAAFDIAQGTWTRGPNTRASPGFAGNGAAVFPGLGLVEYNEMSGEVSLLPPGSTSWQVLRSGLSSTYHPFIEYQPTSDLLFFGGGTGGGGSRNVYVMNRARQVTGPFMSPMTLGTINVTSGGFVLADPRSNDFLFLAAAMGEVWRLPVTSSGVSATQLPSSPLGRIRSGIAVTVHDYGVLLFALSDRNDVMWVYKPSGAPCN